MTYVLDASAVLRFFDGEAGVDRVMDILNENVAGLNALVISAVHWGEVIGIFYKRHGVLDAGPYLARLKSLAFTIIPVTGARAQRSARIKHEHKIPYVDACAVELAGDSPEHVIVTADFDMKPAEYFAKIEFLPTKHKQ